MLRVQAQHAHHAGPSFPLDLVLPKTVNKAYTKRKKELKTLQTCAKTAKESAKSAPNKREEHFHGIPKSFLKKPSPPHLPPHPVSNGEGAPALCETRGKTPCLTEDAIYQQKTGDKLRGGDPEQNP